MKIIFYTTLFSAYGKSEFITGRKNELKGAVALLVEVYRDTIRMIYLGQSPDTHNPWKFMVFLDDSIFFAVLRDCLTLKY